jgi:hypothetical protein
MLDITLENLVEAFQSIIIWTDMLVALVGGTACGLLLIRFMFNPRFDAMQTLTFTFVGAAFIGAVFFMGQFFGTYGRDGGFLAWRVVARYIIWLIFSLGLSLGAGIYLRIQLGRWRERRKGFRRPTYTEGEGGGRIPRPPV